MKESASASPRVRPTLAALAKREHRALWIVFGTSFAVFAATCARTVTGEDSGELIAAAYTVGVAHPPGYPLWTILAKLFTFLPIGEIAFRVALMSAFFAAATTTALFSIIRRLSDSSFAAAGCAFAFALLRDQWSQSVIAEVYTLNSFLLALSVDRLIAWSKTDQPPRRLIEVAFLLGLSLTNHLTALAVVPGFLFFVLLNDRRILLRWRLILKMLAAVVVGLLPYAYLPIAAAMNPAMNWGDPSSWSRFVDHVTRRQYTSIAEPQPRTWERFTDQMDVVRDHALGQGGTLLLVLGVIALFWTLVYRRDLFLLVASTVLMSTVGIVLYTNFKLDFENIYVNRLFFVPAYLFLTIAAGWMIGNLIRAFPRRFEIVCGVAILVGLPAAPVVANYKDCNFAGATLVADYGRELLLSVDQDAILFPSADHSSFPLIYFRHVENLRPDVIIADKYGYLDGEVLGLLPGAANVSLADRRKDGFRREVENHLAAVSDRPLYFTHKRAFPADTQTFMAAEGLWYRVRKKSIENSELADRDRKAWQEIGTDWIDDPALPLDYSAKVLLADVLLARARFELSERRNDEGKKLAARAYEYSPSSKEFLNNLGSMLAENREFIEALGYFRRAVSLDPAYTTARRNIALCLRASGQTDEAWNAFVDIYRADKDDIVANRELGEIAREKEKWGEAVHFLGRFGHMAQDAIALRNAGLIAFYELADARVAKDLIRASLAIDPNQPEIKEFLDGLAHSGEGTVQSAADQIRQMKRMETQFGRFDYSPAPRLPVIQDPESLLPKAPAVPGPKLPKTAPVPSGDVAPEPIGGKKP